MKVAPAWLAVMFGLAGVARTAAAEEAAPLPQGVVRFRTFGSAEGLRNIVVIGITQDASGALWVGTDDGVNRYDGERFTAFSVTDGLPSTQIQVVAVGPDGNVCVGTSAGLACWNGQRFARVGPAEIDVVSLAAYDDRLWIGTTTGLFVAGPDRAVTRAVGWPTARDPVKALWADAHGLIAGHDGTVMTSAGDGRWAVHPGLALAGDRIDGVLRDRHGVCGSGRRSACGTSPGAGPCRRHQRRSANRLRQCVRGRLDGDGPAVRSGSRRIAGSPIATGITGG